MKKLTLLLVTATLFISAQAQKILVKDIPASVRYAFYKMHPSLKDVYWIKDGNNYEADYDAGQVHTSETYSASGKLLATVAEIVVYALPPPVIDYVKNFFKEEEIKQSYKITDALGIVTYTVEIKEMRLFFDSKGNFAKSVKVKATLLVDKE